MFNWKITFYGIATLLIAAYAIKVYQSGVEAERARNVAIGQRAKDHSVIDRRELNNANDIDLCIELSAECLSIKRRD